MTLVFWPAEGDERSEAAEVKGRGAPAATVRSQGGSLAASALPDNHSRAVGMSRTVGAHRPQQHLAQAAVAS